MILQDLHVHTCFSDGKHTPEEVAKTAYEMGVQKLGFSDHGYTSFDNGYCIRKEDEQVYFDTVSKLKEKYRGKMSRTDYRRALHVIGENERVMQGVEFLRKGDISAFGKLLFESHASSRENFENSCPELDALVEIASTMPECLGARLSGGGFGGITIHLIKLSDAERYQKRLETAYYAMTGKEIKCVLCSIGNGATVFLPL